MEHIDMQDWTLGHRIIHDLGFFGHYMHVYMGGRSGKMHILAKLDASGGHLSQRELQERMDISSAALSEVLSKLEAEGLVVRERSDEDRRQMDIALTEAGREQAIMHKRELEAFEVECLSCLGEEEQVQLLGVLDRLAEHWRTMERKEGCA